jgi:hypothetical protein
MKSTFSRSKGQNEREISFLIMLFLESLSVLIFSSCHINVGSIEGLVKVFKISLFIFTVAKCIFYLFFSRVFYKRLYTNVENRASNNTYKKTSAVGYL